MVKQHTQINHVEETKNVKWCVLKVPQYSMKRFKAARSINNNGLQSSSFIAYTSWIKVSVSLEQNLEIR